MAYAERTELTSAQRTSLQMLQVKFEDKMRNHEAFRIHHILERKRVLIRRNRDDPGTTTRDS